MISDRRRRRALIVFASIAVAAVASALLWRFTPLQEWIQPEALRGSLETLRGSPWATPVVCALFLVGGFLLVPVNALFLAVGLAFEFGHALWLSMAGALVSALAVHRVGRHLDLKAVLVWAPERMRKLGSALDQAGIAQLVVLRVLPLGPFTTMNLLWGAAGVPVRRLLAASVVGLAPGVTLTAMVGSGLGGLGERDLGSIGMLAAGVLGLIALGLLTRRKLSG